MILSSHSELPISNDPSLDDLRANLSKLYNQDHEKTSKYICAFVKNLISEGSPHWEYFTVHILHMIYANNRMTIENHLNKIRIDLLLGEAFFEKIRSSKEVRQYFSSNFFHMTVVANKLKETLPHIPDPDLSRQALLEKYNKLIESILDELIFDFEFLEKNTTVHSDLLANDSAKRDDYFQFGMRPLSRNPQKRKEIINFISFSQRDSFVQNLVSSYEESHDLSQLLEILNEHFWVLELAILRHPIFFMQLDELQRDELLTSYFSTSNAYDKHLDFFKTISLFTF